MPKLIADYGIPDVHGTVKGFAAAHGGAMPGQASTAFIAVQTFKEPQMCGSMTIFGLTADDESPAANWGYADDATKARTVYSHTPYVFAQLEAL